MAGIVAAALGARRGVTALSHLAPAVNAAAAAGWGRSLRYSSTGGGAGAAATETTSSASSGTSGAGAPAPAAAPSTTTASTAAKPSKAGTKWGAAPALPARPAGTRVGPRHSGLQKQVLTAYREALRAALGVVGEGDRVPAVQYVRCEFRRHATTVDRLDIQRIEHMLRQVTKRVIMLRGPNGVTFRPAPAATADHARLPVAGHSRSAAAIAGAGRRRDGAPAAPAAATATASATAGMA